MKLIKHQRVSSSISDAAVNLSTLGVFQMVQDATTELMSKLKIDGVTVKKEYNAVWLFVKNRTRFFKDIPWNDQEFTVTAFVSAITRATMCIDTALYDASGTLCTYSRLEICAIDLSSGRIRRIESVGVTADITAEQASENITFTKFEDASMSEVDSVQVRNTNIDMSQHTNNVEYIRFILNTYTVKQLQERKIREMEIKYVNQSYEMDVLTVHKASLENKDLFLIRKGEQEIVKCEVVF